MRMLLEILVDKDIIKPGCLPTKRVTTWCDNIEKARTVLKKYVKFDIQTVLIWNSIIDYRTGKPRVYEIVGHIEAFQSAPGERKLFSLIDRGYGMYSRGLNKDIDVKKVLKFLEENNENY